MNLLVATEGHFSVGDTGAIYAHGPVKYSAWARYLEVFEQVTVLARVGMSRRAWPEETRADGPCVSFCALLDYRGPWQFLRMLPELKARVRQAVAQCDAFILRVPGLVGRVAWREITRVGKPYAVEVVGDPWDVLGPGTWPSLFRPVFRRAGVRDLKSMCKGAMAAHYVTQKALQRRYPPGKDTYAVGFSDALMDSTFASPQAIEKRLQRIDALAAQGIGSAKPFRIGFIGTMAQMYKGPDLLLRAVALCRNRGLNLETILAGEGRQAGAMRDLASKLGIADATEFAGQLSFGKAILDFLDSIDLFVLPSRAEGLPRALLEAMARGCPCIGSDAGGIPELLAADDIFPAGNYKALAEKITQAAGNPLRLRQMAMQNYEVSRSFSPEHLKGARLGFLRHVRMFSKATGLRNS
jgi:glycosyltransferase involved in cell wall biosynthesis